MALAPQTPDWFNRLATLQAGYFYNWHSHLDPWHGEDIFHEFIFQHLRPDMDVLEIACAQGDIALDLAPHCRSVLGYDLTAAWIQLAQETAQARRLSNTAFIQYDLSKQANGGQAHMPTADQAFDLLICSKGPFHWIDDARRAARPGAVLLMLVPDATPLTAWTAHLPESLRWQENDPDWARPTIEQRLAGAQLSLHSWWSFDVPEIFSNPQDLYAWRAWGTTPDEVPSYIEVAHDLEQIFQQYAGPQGLEIRRRRYIWKALIPDE